MNKEEIDILYSFANDEDCRYVYDWQGFNYEEICPLIDKLIKENKKYKEIIDKVKKRLLDLSYLNDELIDRELLDILKEVE